MKKFAILTLACGLAFNAAHAQRDIKLTPDNIDDVVAAMTLDEKAHMVNGIGTFWSDSRNWTDPLGAPGGSYEIPRLGIPSLYFGDGPLGIRMSRQRPYDNHLYSSTAFPTPLLVGSSWNDELVYEMARQMGDECKELGIDVLLGPAFNIHRNPLNGRGQEYYSEDPLLSGKLAAEFVKGVQAAGVGASAKHFAANNQETNRGANNARISQRALREIYLKPFEITVKESDPWTVMTSYNGINGKWTAESEELLEGVLRNDWGFKGAVMTDWGGGNSAAGRMIAGNDLIEPGGMGFGGHDSADAIIDAVKSGALDEKILDRNVKRILGLVVKCWAFKKYPFKGDADVKKGGEIARKVGYESAVLLKNQGNTLPLKRGSNIAIYGQTAYNIIPGGIGHKGRDIGNYLITLIEGMRLAGYTVDWDLLKRYPIPPYPPQNKVASRVVPVEHPEIFFKPEELAAQAKNNESAILVFGHRAGEGTDRTIDEYYLTDDEKKLLNEVTAAYHAVGKKVTVLLNTPGAIEMESWQNIPDAIMVLYNGGQEMGNWIADLLSGKVTPSGKLSITWAKDIYDYPSAENFPYKKQNKEISGMMAQYTPGAKREAPRMKKDGEGEKNVDYTNYEEGIYVGYRYFDTFKKEVSYPFGFGLSYTTFEYSNATINKVGDVFEVKVDVKNTGKFDGKEVVQLYVAAPKSKLETPDKELKGYAKTKTLKPGETQTVTISVKESDLASFNTAKSSWVVAPGTYKFMVASSSVDVKCTLDGKAKASVQKVGNYLAPDGPLNEIHRPK